MKVYLCGPINGCTDEEANGWRSLVKDTFSNHNQKYNHPGLYTHFLDIDPMKRDYRGVEADVYREIVDLDKLDIRNADALLVYYEKPSVGTSMEMFYAWTLGKPIVMLTPEGTRISPWLRYHTTKIMEVPKGSSLKETINKAVSWLETI